MPSFNRPLQSLLIKPSGPDCNLDCSYCFYLEKESFFPATKTHRMSEETLEIMIKQALESSRGQISLAWQGGEPTLMGLPFFKMAIEIQKRHSRGHDISSALQTNGVLIDQNWAEFLHENKFLVGLSLDGPAHIHDRYRVDKAGEGSFEKVQDTAHLLLKNEVEVNALIVVNDYAVQFPDEIYQYHKNLGLTYMQFIPCVEYNGVDISDIAPFSVSPEAYGQFLCRTFDLWKGDIVELKENTSIRFFDSVFRYYVGIQSGDCTLLANCGTYLTVEHDGSVYSCDFYVDEDNLLGNVHEEKLHDMLNGEKQIAFGSAKSKLPEECLSCEWLTQCRGGCPKDRIHEGDGAGLHYLCKAFKIFFAHADATFKELARAWKTQQDEFARQKKTLKDIQLSGINISGDDLCPCESGRKFKRCCGLGL